MQSEISANWIFRFDFRASFDVGLKYISLAFIFTGNDALK